MAQYLDKAALVAEIERKLKNINLNYVSVGSHPSDSDTNKKLQDGISKNLQILLSFINTIEVKEVDLDLITAWFDHIAQIADDRMTLTNQRMTDAHALDEIKCLAKDSAEFITKYYKTQKGE